MKRKQITKNAEEEFKPQFPFFPVVGDFDIWVIDDEERMMHVVKACETPDGQLAFVFDKFFTTFYQSDSEHELKKDIDDSEVMDDSECYFGRTKKEAVENYLRAHNEVSYQLGVYLSKLYKEDHN